jgi:hypothetical protein
MLRECEDIFAIERFTATEDKDRLATFGKRIDEGNTLLGGHVLLGQFRGHIDPAAVDALQVAAGGRFPEDQAELIL